MKGIDDLTASLTTELLVEMADSFFGARKALDEEKERFQTQVSVVKALGEATLDRISLLHRILLEDAYVRELYASLGVSPEPFIRLVQEPSNWKISPPFALTSRKRYEKLILRTYGEAARYVHRYLHGEYYDDPQLPGRKRLSPSYLQLETWAAAINKKIRKVNEGHSPSSVINFSKSLNGSQVRYECISEATIDGYSNSLDQSLAISSLDFQASGLHALPELPVREKVKPQLVQFARGLYKQHKERINALLEHLKT